MTFQEILPKFLEGKKIRREYWRDPKSYIYIKNGELYNEKDIRNYPEEFYFDGEDFMADNREIYKEEEYFDWSKAYQLMKDGCKVRRKSVYTDDKNYYMFIDKKTGYFNDSTGEHFGVHPDDIDAIDWYLVEG